MTKSELRTLYRAKRQALSADELDQFSRSISNQVSHALQLAETQEPIRLHVFLPIQSQNEVNTWFLIRKLWQDFPLVQLVTSVSDFSTGTMTHYSLTPETPLILNGYGIPEPGSAHSRKVATAELDSVLVPLLIFDRQGHRVGYGKGFYDRFLAHCRPDCLKIGLSLFEPVDSIDDVVQTDIPLDWGVTPDTGYSFTSLSVN